MISANLIPLSNVELVIPKFTIFNKNLLHISILSLKREEEMQPDGHKTLVFSIEISFWISSISVGLKGSFCYSSVYFEYTWMILVYNCFNRISDVNRINEMMINLGYRQCCNCIFEKMI